MVYLQGHNTIGVIDYGMGNLFSTQKAIEKTGFKCEIISNPQSISKFDCIVLPGVGGFPMAMENLKNSKFDSEIIDFVDNGKKLVGICLGMQLLVESSQENHFTKGFGFIPGSCEKLPVENKLPRINWCDVEIRTNKPTNLLQFNNRSFYFVHSYYVNCEEDLDIVATSTYGNFTYPVIIRRNNVIGIQFHPEKSSQVGLDLYAEILKM